MGSQGLSQVHDLGSVVAVRSLGRLLFVVAFQRPYTVFSCGSSSDTQVISHSALCLFSVHSGDNAGAGWVMFIAWNLECCRKIDLSFVCVFEKQSLQAGKNLGMACKRLVAIL